MRIGVDLMGSETSPQALFEGVLKAQSDLSAEFVVFATDQVVAEIKSSIISEKALHSLHFEIVEEVVDMDDDPLLAVRRKKASSMMRGIEFLKNNTLNAFVTLGNTGALVAGAYLNLPRLSGISRPALLASLPTSKGSVAVVDVGANVSATPKNLVEFALMGAAYKKCLGLSHPSVGLLNIGVESKKGTDEVRKAHKALSSPLFNDQFRFIGNIEPTDVFSSELDVLVTDGFSGNVFLKASEGVAHFIINHFEENLSDGKKTYDERYKTLKERIDVAEYAGAIVAGIDAVVIKCHGSSTAKALYKGLLEAFSLGEKNLLKSWKIKSLSSDEWSDLIKSD